MQVVLVLCLACCDRYSDCYYRGFCHYVQTSLRVYVATLRPLLSVCVLLEAHYQGMHSLCIFFGMCCLTIHFRPFHILNQLLSSPLFFHRLALLSFPLFWMSLRTKGYNYGRSTSQWVKRCVTVHVVSVIRPFVQVSSVLMLPEYLATY